MKDFLMKEIAERWRKVIIQRIVYVQVLIVGV